MLRGSIYSLYISYIVECRSFASNPNRAIKWHAIDSHFNKYARKVDTKTLYLGYIQT